MRPRAFFLGGLLAVIFASVALGAAKTTYADQIAEAKRLTEEKSWALARDAFDAALKLAPDTDAKRWCELWVADASWQADDPPKDWSERQRWQEKHQRPLDELLTPYAQDAAKEEFWIAATEVLAEVVTQGGRGSAWELRRTIADFLGGQPPSRTNAKHYVEFLQKHLLDGRSVDSREVSPLLAHCDRATQLAALPDDRAALALAGVHLAGMWLPRDSARAQAVKGLAVRWERALASAQGTRWEAVARAEHFAWRMNASAELTSDNPAPDFPALLEELATLRAVVLALDGVGAPPAENTLKMLQRLETEWTLPHVVIALPGMMRPGAPIQFSYGAANVQDLRFELRRHTPEILAARFGRQTWDEEDNPPGEIVRTWAVPVRDEGRHEWHSEVVPIAPALDAGIYSLTALGAGGNSAVREVRTFLVTNVGAMQVSVPSSPGADELLVYARDSYAPLANAAIHGAILVRRAEQKIQTWDAVTDSDGRVKLPAVDFGKESYDHVVLVALVAGQPVVVHSDHDWQMPPRPPYVIDVFFDRELFQPGETVHWKAITREHRDGRFVVPDGKVRVNVELDDEELQEPQEFALNNFGTVHGDIPIPSTARPGQLRLELDFVDAAGAVHSGVGAFVGVDNFVTPAVYARVEIPDAPDTLRPGREVTVRVRADYFSGGPMVGAKVECSFAIYPDYSFVPTEQKDSQFEDWRKELNGQPRVGLTGTDGAAEFRLLLPEFVPAPAGLQVDARVVPEGGQAVSAEYGARITDTGLVATEVVGDTPVARPGESRVFRWSVTDGLAQPAAFRGDAQLIEKRWVEAWLDPQGAIVTGPALDEARRVAKRPPADVLPPPWQKLHASYVETVVTTLPVRSGADGRVEAAFTLPHAGIFRAQLATGDQPLLPLFRGWDESSGEVYAVDETTTTLAFAPERTAITSAGIWRKGTPLRLFVVLPAGQRDAFLVLTGESTTQTRRIAFADRVGLVTIDAPPPVAGFLRASLGLLVGDSERDRSRATIPEIDESSRLHVELRASEESARPGARGSVIARVTDASGQPVPAELALAASDEAVNQLWNPDWTGDLNFDSYERGIGVRIDAATDLPEEVVTTLRDPRPGAGGDSANRRGAGLEPFEYMSEFARADVPSATLAGSRTRLTMHDPDAVVAALADRVAHDKGEGGAGDGEDAAEPPIVIRQHFASTAFWAPELVADQNGEARVEFTYPDNLTQWRIEAYAVGGTGHSFGRAKTTSTTSLPFQARLQVPRVLVVGDTTEPSALLVNRTDSDRTATVRLSIAGPLQITQASAVGFETVDVPKQAEARTTWTMRATAPGEVVLTLRARAGDEADAMREAFPVLEDGIVQDTAAGGRLAAGARKRQLKLPLPQKLDRTRTEVALQLSGSHAAALIDALPYLIDYPYGCVEQTMSRFLPAVVVQKTLVDFGLDEAALERRLLARESAPGGFARLDEVVAQSLARLAGARMENDGFGWWSGAKHADLWMTAYVVWGLALAKEAGIDVPINLSVDTEFALVGLIDSTEESDDRLAWAIAAAGRYSPLDVHAEQLKKSFMRAYDARQKLTAAGRACLALAAVKFGDDEQRAVLLRNLENGAQRVEAGDLGDTVHWGATGNYWRAMDGAVESTALTLLALLELDPTHPLIEPAVNWLVLNRRSAHWASTRDTAFAILALSKYIATHGELDADAEVDVFANGKKVQRVKFTRESLLAGDTTIAIDPKLLRGGNNTIELRRVGGKSPVYAVALASSWARGDAVKPQGHLINVARGFVRQKQEPTLLGTLRITPEPLPADGKANAAVAGEQVTARVTLNVPNELEYVMVEVPKPAGCEPLNPLSGYDARLVRVGDQPLAGLGEAGAVVTDPGYSKHGSAGASPSIPEDTGVAIYREEHDDKSVFFIDALAAGTWEIVFSLRATTPGNYRALSAEASAMYVPEVRANSDAQRVRIERRTD